MGKAVDYNRFEIKNRKAKFEFKFLQEFEAGLVLKGTEIKSIRAGEANLNDAFCAFQGMELFLRNMYVAEYKEGSYHNHETRRTRKLLLKRSELKKLKRRVDEKGMTIVPYRLYFSDRGLVKIVIALAEGKKTYDKRDTIKARDQKRELDRIKKQYK